MTTTPCSHCNVSHVCSPSPAAFTTLRAGKIEFNNQFCILKFLSLFHVQKQTLSFYYNAENTILDKNVKKNAPCMFNFRILPSKAEFSQDTPPPKKNNVEG